MSTREFTAPRETSLLKSPANYPVSQSSLESRLRRWLQMNRPSTAQGGSRRPDEHEWRRYVSSLEGWPQSVELTSSIARFVTCRRPTVITVSTANLEESQWGVRLL